MDFCPHCKRKYDKEDGGCPICGHPDDCECSFGLNKKDDFYDEDDEDYTEEDFDESSDEY
jgi:hypothetical protein